MKVRLPVVMALLAGVALLTVPGSGAGQPQGTRPPPETEAQRIARETIAAVRASEQGTLNTSLAPLPASQRRVVAGPLAGRWTTCQLPEGFNPVHASVLPDGTVLLMAGSGNDPADLAAGRFQSYLFAPDTCAATRLPTPGDLFCSGHAMLPNGNILVAGGTKRYDPFYGLRTSYEYDWINKRFVPLPLMAGGGRWYPGATQLGSGDVFVLSGLNGAGAQSDPLLNLPATFLREVGIFLAALAPGASRPIASPCRPIPTCCPPPAAGCSLLVWPLADRRCGWGSCGR